jgi:hypothetical protein
MTRIDVQYVALSSHVFLSIDAIRPYIEMHKNFTTQFFNEQIMGMQDEVLTAVLLKIQLFQDVTRSQLGNRY